MNRRIWNDTGYTIVKPDATVHRVVFKGSEQWIDGELRDDTKEAHRQVINACWPPIEVGYCVSCRNYCSEPNPGPEETKIIPVMGCSMHDHKHKQYKTHLDGGYILSQAGFPGRFIHVSEDGHQFVDGVPRDDSLVEHRRIFMGEKLCDIVIR
jgi:hypothetical protein